jgi:hypothetical protein
MPETEEYTVTIFIGSTIPEANTVSIIVFRFGVIYSSLVEQFVKTNRSKRKDMYRIIVVTFLETLIQK